MKFIILIFLGCVNSLLLSAQDDAALRAIRARNTMTQFSDGTANLGSSGVYGLASSEEIKLEGNAYWDAHWGLSSLEIKGYKELVEGNYVRYDIYRNELEFLFKDGIKVLPGSKIVSIVWQDSLLSRPRFLVRGELYQENGIPLTGFVEILVDKNVKLIKRIMINTKMPNYNPALDVGSKNPKIVQENQYYYAIDNKLVRMKSKKDLQEWNQVHHSKIDAFIKANKIKFNNDFDLVKLVEYYNLLQEGG